MIHAWILMTILTTPAGHITPLAIKLYATEDLCNHARDHMADWMDKMSLSTPTCQTVASE